MLLVARINRQVLWPRSRLLPMRRLTVPFLYKVSLASGVLSLSAYSGSLILASTELPFRRKTRRCYPTGFAL